MQRTLKIFLACAIGAGVGTLLALEFHRYFWWAGLLIGGLVGYLSYEFKEVLAVIHTAWQKAIGYRPDKQRVVKNFLVSIAVFNVFASFVLLSWMVTLMTNDIKTLPEVPATIFGVSLVCGWIGIAVRVTDDNYGKLEDFASLKKAILFLNPIAIFTYWPVYYLLKIGQGVIFATKKIPRATLMLIRFVKMVFVLIHSDIRFLCGIDAAIGVAIGYFAGSAVIGFFAGGIVGVLNYEVISKRVLHLNKA